VKTTINKALNIATLLMLSFVILFCCFFLLSDHNSLVKWYLSLNNCIYNYPTWGSVFFTESVKKSGDLYCIVALVISLIGIIVIIKRWKYPKVQQSNNLVGDIGLMDTIFLIISLVSGFILWLWGNSISLPAYDEVFSAQNIAGINPFQAISYYMLPNNHVFYNLLNGLFFHGFADKVISGRILSLFAYMGVITVVFFWLQKLVETPWIKCLITLALASQFMIWGFSFQARGYELYLLAEWGMFASLYRYVNSGNSRWLFINMVCITAGYFCMPSFLYFHAAQVLFMLFYWVVYKKAEISFWKYQLLSVMATFLLYLPLLCFSGLDSISNNHYVKPMGRYKTAKEFADFFFPYFKPYVEHIFSDITLAGHHLNYLLCFLPLGLLFFRKNKCATIFGLFYLSMWASFFALVFVMKRPPFERNLLGNYSITLMAVLLTFYWLLSTLMAKIKKVIESQVIFKVVFALAPVFLIVHFIRTDIYYLKDTLYEYEVNTRYNEVRVGLNLIPRGSKVDFSDESFYARYILEKKGITSEKCSSFNSDFVIKQDDEVLPSWVKDQYYLIGKVNEFNIYQKGK